MHLAYPSEVQRDIAARYAAGEAASALAKEFGIGKPTICRYVRQAGITLRPQGYSPGQKTRPPKHAPEVQREITARYAAGERALTLAEEFDVDKVTIFNYIHQAGVATRPQGGFPGMNARWDSDTRQTIVSRYADGVSSDTLVEDYGVTRKTILNYLHTAGSTPREAGGPRLYSHNPDAFKEITPESAYWIGFLMADGCVTDKNILKVCLKGSDRDHLEKLRAFLQAENPIRESHTPTGHHVVSLAINSRPLAESLATHGVVPRKSLTAKASKALANNHDFWRGVIDGDGYLGWKRSDVYWYPELQLACSRPLIEQFLTFVNHIHPTKATIRPHGNVAITSLGPTTAKSLVTTLYQDCTVVLDRKNQRAQQMIALPYSVRTDPRITLPPP